MDKKPHNFEQITDSTFRPGTWDEYIGQESIKANLNILLTAANKRNQIPEHILFYGPPGLVEPCRHAHQKRRGAHRRDRYPTCRR